MKSYLPTLVAIAVAVFTGLGIWYFLENIVGQRSYGAGGAPNEHVEYLIDTDSANGVDDVLAIIAAVARDDRGKRAPRLAGITAAHFHAPARKGRRTADESQAVNERLVQLLERPQLRTLAGSNRPLPAADQPLKSPAAAFIAERASRASPRNKLQIFVLGPCTNVASAILLDPAIVPVIHVHYLGLDLAAGTEMVTTGKPTALSDPLALELLLNTAGLEMTALPASVSTSLRLRRSELDTLLPRNTPLARYVAKRWDVYAQEVAAGSTGTEAAGLGSLAVLAAWYEPGLATLDTNVALADGQREKIRVYSAVTGGRMRDDYFRSVGNYVSQLNR